MGSLNKVLLIGVLGRDPQEQTTKNGHLLVNLSLAVTEYSSDKKKVDWYKIDFWNKAAENVLKYCKKGTQVYIEGKLNPNQWQDKDGNKKYNLNILGNSFQILDRN
jgi:single-strand DNA-binding protein